MPPKDTKTAAKPKTAKPQARSDGSAKGGGGGAKALTPWQSFSRSDDAIAVLCDYIVQGGHLAGFCKERGFSYTTALMWIQADTKRVEMYARAREDRSDVLADEIVSISDEAEARAKLDGEDVVVQFDSAAVSRNKLRVDARKWVASKLKPRTYGDKVQVDATVNVREIDDEELHKRIAAFLGLPGHQPS